MQVYVEAYSADGKQILGNLDGQGAFECENYRRTSWYKGLAYRKTLNNRVAIYRIVDEDGKLFETVRNETH